MPDSHHSGCDRARLPATAPIPIDNIAESQSNRNHVSHVSRARNLPQTRRPQPRCIDVNLDPTTIIPITIPTITRTGTAISRPFRHYNLTLWALKRADADCKAQTTGEKWAYRRVRAIWSTQGIYVVIANADRHY